jgi:uncharacterized protein YjiK
MLRSASALVVSVVSLALSAGPVTATDWPAGKSKNIGQSLNKKSEPSGIVWDQNAKRLWVVGDEGKIYLLERNGSKVGEWSESGDLEAVTVTGTASKIYVGVESPPQIQEYTLDKGKLTAGHQWTLDVPVAGADGMEGLTWVPNGEHPYGTKASGGVFFASSQKDGHIYIYDVDLTKSGAGTRLGDFSPTKAENDISDLYFSATSHLLYVLYDGANKLLTVDPTTTSFTVKNTYDLPSGTDSQEGVTLDCSGSQKHLYLADDTNKHVIHSFNGFPCQ